MILGRLCYLYVAALTLYITTFNSASDLQDTTARVWDVRMMASPVYAVSGQREFSSSRTLLGDIAAGSLPFTIPHNTHQSHNFQ